jgi:DNA polymerase-1
MNAAVETPDAIKRKTYRESLANNRDNILLSKELVTIHTSVPIEADLSAMQTQPPDLKACSALFTELEFTTLLKELAPAPDTKPASYKVRATPQDLAELLAAARKEGHLALALAETQQALSEELPAEPDDPNADPDMAPEPEPPQTMSLFGAGAFGYATPDAGSTVAASSPAAAMSDPACRIGLSVDPSHAIEVGLETPGLREALADPSLPKHVHDLKAVLRALEPHHAGLSGAITDVMLQSYLLNPTHGSHTLVDIAARTTSRALTHQPSKDNPSDPQRLPEAAAAVARLAIVLAEQMAESAPVEHNIPHDRPELGGATTPEMLFAEPAKAVATDASKPGATDSIDPSTAAQLSQHSPLLDVYTQMDLPLVPVLLRMEQAGVRVDLDLLRDQSSRLAVQIDDLAERIYAASGHRFNVSSPKQLGDVLFNRMNLPKPLKYGKGKVVSTAQDILEDLAPEYPVVRDVLEHRQLSKLKGTYLDALPSLADANQRIHTTFNQVGTATGRLSSTNPNLQNIPIRTAVGREIRAAFIASSGNLLMSADYSQIELRLMAHFSQDPLLLDAYRTGKDIHTLTAAEVFEVDPATMSKETRARAKAVNFGIVYGISPFGLAAQLNIDQKTAREYIDRYFDRYKGVSEFIARTLDEVRRAQSVRTAFGRVRPIPDIHSRNPNQRGFAERTAVNTPLQGTAADLIKLAMIRIDAEFTRRNLRSVMTLQVHDELLFDVVPEEADEVRTLVRAEMESVANFSVPIVAEVGLGNNWRDIK